MDVQHRTAHRGSVLHFNDDPGLQDDPRAYDYWEQGVLIVADGHIEAVGPAAALLPAASGNMPVVDHGERLIMPGFIDTHIHYPQTDVIASGGRNLLDWLERYTYPAEERFADDDHAREVAGFFLDELLRNGTTTAQVLCTVHKSSVEIFFRAAAARGLRMIAGKTLMDRHCPQQLRDSAAEGEREMRELIETWHGQERLHYAITPRFAATSSVAQLQSAGRLALEYPDVFIHSHLAENRDEVGWIRELFPDARSYLDVYDRFGLLRDRATYAHCIYLDATDRARMAASGAGAAFAPTSNLYLGSGLFDIAASDAAGMRFTELLRTGKFLDDAFYYLGLIAEKHDDPERALRLYAQVQTGEYFVSTLLRAATILQNHGDAPAADQLLDRLVDDTPEQAPEIFAARARIYADAGDIERGLQVLDWGVLQYPDNVDVHYALAATYEQAGRVPEALRELSALAKARPEDPAALNALGYTLADHDKQLSHARALIERAHAAAPKNAAILDSMGWVRFRQGNAEQALPYLSEAYADDRGGDIAAHLGEVQWTLGHQAEADRIWSAAAIVDPDNRLLKSTRQRMHSLK